MQSLSELRLHTISIDSFATPCTVYFAIQLSLTEFRKHGLVSNTGVRFIAPILVEFVSTCTPCPALYSSEGGLVNLIADLETYRFLMAFQGSPASTNPSHFLCPLTTHWWMDHFKRNSPLHSTQKSSCLIIHCSGYSKTKHNKKCAYDLENTVHDGLSPYASPYILYFMSVKVACPCMRCEVRRVGENKSRLTR